MCPQESRGKGGLSRRGLFTAAGAGGIGLAAGAAGAFAAGRERRSPANDVVPLYGAHQAGITTDAQDHMHTAAFDLTASTRQSVISLLRDWTEAAEAMTAGRDVGATGASGGAYDAPPEDTGEAQDLHAAHLTITFGFGRTLFEKDGEDRYGVRSRLPAALIDLPLFPGDALEPNRTGGDLMVQACADDPQVAVHAVRNLSRIAFGRGRVRWSQLGFGRTASTSTGQVTPRNLFGFKDGTANIMAQDRDLLDKHVWVGGSPAAEAWLDGGTYAVMRRIRMHVETWDRTTLREQELVVGRTKREGAPLSGGDEFTAPDFSLPGRNGPLIDAGSHLALAHPDHNGGVHMLRRGYNYADGTDDLGRFDAGQFFVAYLVDPRSHYVPMQSAMAKNDLMAEYLRHTGSGLFAVPPGIQAGEYIGQSLFS